MKQLTILTDNRPGVLAEIAERLGNNGINMESISAETFADGAIIRMVTRDVAGAKKALANTGYKLTESEILLFSADDRAGSLAKIARILEKSKINIEHIYLLTKKGGRGIFAAKVNRMDDARKALAGFVAEDF
ncbi:MAG: ACT domain-containing protein [Candidatus Diapherotrites archaeon]